MSSFAWSDYVSADGSGLNTDALLEDFKNSSGITDLTETDLEIFRSTVEATVWSYPLEETHRYFNLNTITQAPRNQLFKPDFAASWLNKNSAPAPNASLLYMTSWLDLSKRGEDSANELILQLPANPDGNYYVLAVLDSYINTIGSFGPRDPLAGADDAPQYVLLAGPNSIHYGSDKSATITDDQGGQTTMPVLQVDTPRAWITARINTNTLDPTAMAATRTFINGDKDEVGTGFQLTTLDQFKRDGTVPYAKPITQSTSSDAAFDAFGAVPTLSKDQPNPAKEFFTQVSRALALNPVPAQQSRDPGNTPPPYQVWIDNQNVLQNASREYQPPSALGTARKDQLNRRFETIGLNLDTGFTQPSSWTDREKAMFDASYLFTLKFLSKATDALVKGQEGTNNGWSISNKNVGVYPNDWESWLVRAGVAVEGAAANIPNDAVYPTTEIDAQGNALTSTYTYRIALPKRSTTTDSGNPVELYGPAKGFWAYTIYQPNPGNNYQPFLIENAIRNTSYSPINATATLTIDGQLRTKTPGNWNSGTAKGTALLTGKSQSDIAVEGLDPDTIYYVKDVTELGSETETDEDDELLLTLASEYQPDYGSNGIAIGGQGSPGEAIQLSGPRGSTLSFGWINPVAQLGSNQQKGISSDEITLQTESDGSINLSLSNLAPQSNLQNWLPTPLVTGSGSSDLEAASAFQVMARFYWPTSDISDGAKSILANPKSSDVYAPPAVERQGLNRIHTWDLLSSAAEAQVKSSDPSFGSTSPLDTPSPYSSEVVGALIDLTILPDALDGEVATVNYSYSRNADYDNQLFFYAIDDITGTINGLSPGDRGYLKEAWSQRLEADTPIVADRDATREGTIELTAGQLYAPIVMTGNAQMFTAYDNANARDYRHFNLISKSSFGFEDQIGGGDDHDRNDGIFTVTSIDL